MYMLDDVAISSINPGTIIRIKAQLGRWYEWFYAIRLHDSVFYVIATEQAVTLSDVTLLRADLDNRLEIIEHE